MGFEYEPYVIPPLATLATDVLIGWVWHDDPLEYFEWVKTKPEVPDMTLQYILKIVEEDVMTYNPNATMYLVGVYHRMREVFPDINDAFGICTGAYGLYESPSRGMKALGLKRKRIYAPWDS